MKKLIILCILLALAYCIIPSVSFAEENVTFDEVFSNLLEALDGESLNKELNQYWGRFNDGNDGFSDKVNAIISGDFALNYSNVFTAIFAMIFSGLKDLIPILLTVSCIALLYAIVKSLSPEKLEGIGRVLFFACYASILSLLIYKTYDVISNCYKGVEKYSMQMEAVFPLIITMMTATGATVSASVYTPAVAFLSSGITNLIKVTVMPLTVVLIVFSAVSGLAQNFKMEKIKDVISSVIKWILGICITVFTMFLSIQGLTAGMYDGITLRITKYAIGNSVPIVGGFLKDGVDLFLASGLLIKNALGIFGLILVVGAILSPIIELIAFSFFLRLTAGIIEPFSDGKISSFTYGLGKNLNYVFACVIIVSFLYVLTIVLLICTGGALI